jgi:hypothetical protein
MFATNVGFAHNVKFTHNADFALDAEFTVDYSVFLESYSALDNIWINQHMHQASSFLTEPLSPS